MGLLPKSTPARVLSGEEQAFIAALDDLREKLEDFTRTMEARAKLRRMLDRGMTQEEAKQFSLDHSDDVLAHLNAPWREKVGENQYKGSCGCVFDAEGNRLKWCGDHY